MDLFDVLNLIGGLSLFLFGMTLMGQALERRAGNKLKALLGRMTTNRLTGLLTGLGVTAIIQSSSATTVMVVGFVNSGLMTLKQSINVIMGANIGTTVTAWILSLAGIESSNVFVKLLKPSSFTPILALLGIIFFMVSKNSKRKDTGSILPTDVSYLYESCSWSHRRCGPDGHYTVQLCISRYFTGACFNRCSFLRCSYTDYYGTEYWYLHNGDTFFDRYNQKCKKSRACSFCLQPHRSCRMADGFLAGKNNFFIRYLTFFVPY